MFENTTTHAGKLAVTDHWLEQAIIKARYLRYQNVYGIDLQDCANRYNSINMPLHAKACEIIKKELDNR